MLSLLVWSGLACVVLSGCSQGQIPSIVSIQLKWLQQTQFAGYFAAQEQGFYDDECLTVNIRPGGPSITIEDEVLQGRAEFGVHWTAQTMLALNQNKSVTIVAQIFQRVGMSMVTWKYANIRKVTDFVGKRVCVWMGGNEGNLRAAFAENNLTWDSNSIRNKTSPENNAVDIISQGFSMEMLLNNECDVASATTYNEFAQILISQKSPGVLYTKSDLHVMQYHTALLEDSIIASTEWLDKSEENRETTVKFLRASFRGWMWARANPEKTVKLFADKGPLQIWQMNEVNRLIWPSALGVGIVENHTLQESADIAFKFNLTDRLWEVEEFYRPEFAIAAHQGLDQKSVRGEGFVALDLSFCLNTHGDPEICDTSKEAGTSFVETGSSTGVVLIVVTLIGIVFACVCFGLLLKWRGEKVVKSSSLRFSILMCIGAFLGLLSNFFLIGKPTDGVCHLRAWLMGVGFVTFIGNFLVKVWRIHVIFNAKVLMKVKIPDSRLYFYFSCLLALQVIILGSYSGIGNPTVQRVAHLKDYSTYDTVCVANEANTWNLLIALYAGVLLLYGVYLAVQVRNLVSLFNEAKLLGGSIYNMLFVAAICGPILLFLDMPPTAAALIRGLAMFTMFTGSLAIVFVPKFCIVLSKTGGGEGAVSKASSNDNHLSSITIDMESLKIQDTHHLISQKEKALTLIKAIDGELDRRAGRGSTAGMPSFINSKLSREMSRETSS